MDNVDKLGGVCGVAVIERFNIRVNLQQTKKTHVNVKMHLGKRHVWRNWVIVRCLE